jgi:hypothetical protein
MRGVRLSGYAKRPLPASEGKAGTPHILQEQSGDASHTFVLDYNLYTVGGSRSSHRMCVALIYLTHNYKVYLLSKGASSFNAPGVSLFWCDSRSTRKGRIIFLTDFALPVTNSRSSVAKHRPTSSAR